MKRQPLPRPLRRALWARCAETCEACGYWLRSDELQAHHRKLKSQGGLDELTNLLAVHVACHTGPRGIHMNPERSYDLGHLVRSYAEPSEVPVVLFPLMFAEPWRKPA